MNGRRSDPLVQLQLVTWQPFGVGMLERDPRAPAELAQRALQTLADTREAIRRYRDHPEATAAEVAEAQAVLQLLPQPFAEREEIARGLYATHREAAGGKWPDGSAMPVWNGLEPQHRQPWLAIAATVEPKPRREANGSQPK